MLVENGQIIAIDKVVTDGVTISGDGVNKPIGLDHIHDESKWEAYKEDDRNLTPKKKGSSITLTLADTISANGNPTTENNSIYIGENISANTTDSVIAMNAAVSGDFSYDYHNWQSRKYYSNTADLKTIGVDISGHTFNKKVYGKPTTLEAVSNSIVLGAGNEVVSSQNNIINGFDNSAKETSRDSILGFKNSLESANNIEVNGSNNSANHTEYIKIVGGENSSYQCTIGQLYGYKNYIGNATYSRINGSANDITYSNHDSINGVINSLKYAHNTHINGHHNVIACDINSHYNGGYISAENNKNTFMFGDNITAKNGNGNIVFNNVKDSTYEERTPQYTQGQLKLEDSTNNIINKENVYSSYYNYARGIISIETSADGLGGNNSSGNYVYSFTDSLLIGVGHSASYGGYGIGIGVDNKEYFVNRFSLIGDRNTASYGQYVSILGAGNKVYGSNIVFTMGEVNTASNRDYLDATLNNNIYNSNSVIAYGHYIDVVQSQGVFAVGNITGYQYTYDGSRTISAYSIQDSILVGNAISSVYGQKHLIIGQQDFVTNSQNTNVFGFRNNLTGASKTEVLGDDNRISVLTRKLLNTSTANVSSDNYGIYYNYDPMNTTYYQDTDASIQVLGSHNSIYCSAITYFKDSVTSSYKYRPMYPEIAVSIQKELGLYVNGRRNYINGWGMMKVFAHDSYIYGFHDFIDINGDNITINGNVHKTIMYGDAATLNNVNGSILFVKGSRVQNVHTSLLMVKGMSNSSVNNIFESNIHAGTLYAYYGVLRSNINIGSGYLNGSITDSNLNITSASIYAPISRSDIKTSNPIYISNSISNSNVDMDLSIPDAYYGNTINIYNNICHSDVRLYGSFYYSGNGTSNYIIYYSKVMGGIVGSNVYEFVSCDITTSTSEISGVYYSNIHSQNSRHTRDVIHSNLNLYNVKIDVPVYHSNILSEYSLFSGNNIAKSNIIAGYVSGDAIWCSNVFGTNHNLYLINHSVIMGENCGITKRTEYISNSQVIGYNVDAQTVVKSQVFGNNLSAYSIIHSDLNGQSCSARNISYGFYNCNTGNINGLTHDMLVGYQYTANEIHKTIGELNGCSADYISNSFINNESTRLYNIYKSLLVLMKSTKNSATYISNSIVIDDSYGSGSFASINGSTIVGNSIGSENISAINFSNITLNNTITANNLAYTIANISNASNAHNNVNTILNVRDGSTIQSTYFGLCIGETNNVSGAEKYNIIGSKITATINPGRYGWGLSGSNWKRDSNYESLKYFYITGATFIQGTCNVITAKHFGEAYNGYTIEKPNSTFLFANGTTALDNLNLTAFGNNIGEISNVSSTFLIAPEEKTVFSAVASTSAGYVEHTDIETTNSGKSIVNVEYLLSVISTLEEKIKKLEESHVYTDITEDNIDTLSADGVVYIDVN